MIVLGLVQHMALLMALALVQQTLPRGAALRWLRNHLYAVPALKGLVFGAFGIVAMLTPLDFAPGIIFDARSVILAVAGLFGGPVVAAVAAAMCGAYRLWLGGVGALMGVFVIAESAALGVLFHRLRKRSPRLTGYLPLWGFGLLVHAVMMTLMLLLPAETRWEVIGRVGPVVLILYPLATMVVCRMFVEQENRAKSEAALGKSEAKYRELVESANSIILRWDTSGRITFFNEFASRFFGFSQEEIIGRNLMETIVPPNDGAGRDLAEMIRDIVVHPERYESNQNENMRKDGTRVWVAWTNRAILDDRGQCVELLAVGNDITALKRTEEALALAHGRLRCFVDSNIVGVIIGTPDGVLLEANDYYLNLLGFTRDEFNAGKLDWRAATPPEWLAADEACIRELRQQGTCTPYEKEYVRRDGTRVPVLLTDTLLPGPEELIAAFVLDLTERRRAEEALRQSEAELQCILDTTIDGVLAVSNDGRIIRTNRHLGEMLHIPQAMLDAQDDGPVLQLVVDQVSDPGAFLRRVQALYQSNDKDTDEIVFKDGRVYERYSAPLALSGTAPGRVWFFRDITARRRAEKDYQTLFLEMMEGFALHEIVCDEDGTPADYRFLAVNPAFERMTGLRKEKILGRSVLELLPGTEPKWIETYGRVALTGDPVCFESYSAELQKHFEVRAFRPVPNQFACIFSDITERKRAEEELRRSEHNLAEAERIGNTGSWRYDAASDTAVWSHNMFQIFDVDPAMPRELVFKHFVENLVHSDDRAHVLSVFQDALAGKRPYDLEYRTVRRDGSIRSIHALAETLRDDHGRAIRMIGRVDDITERKRAEEALRVSEEEFHSLAEAMPQIVWTTRADGWNTYFNQQWVDYTGLTLEESHGHGWNTPFHPDDQQRAWDAWQRATQEDAPYSIECRLRRFDGVYHWWLIRGVPLRGANGEILKWFGTCTDIEDIKQAERMLRESEDRLGGILFSMADWVWEVDANGVYTFSSQRGLDFFGPSREEILGKTPFDFMPPDEAARMRPIFADIVARKAPIKALENWNIAKNGELICLLTNGVPILDAEGNLKGYRGVDTDITARKRAERTLRESELKYRLLTENIKDVVWVLDVESQRFVYLSPSVERLRGYTPEEVLGAPTIQSLSREDRARMAGILRSRTEDLLAGRASADTFYTDEAKQFCKDGSTIWTEVITSFYVNEENGRVEVRGVTRDISERKRVEELARTRLALVEFAADHTLDELLTKALDEISGLVNSPIAFYHFVESDQQTLSLQQWSTRTRNEFCWADPKGMHRPIEQAGVWVDCVRERRPVIHNDYASLEHKKGHPEGHAEIIRELVVPVIRQDRIVAILGVGNSPADYTEEDVKMVTYLSDVTWDIVEHKRAEEELRESEARLAMALEVAGAGIWEWNLARDETRFDERFHALLGYAPGELPTALQEWMPYHHPEDVPVWKAKAEAYLRGDSPVYESEHRVRTKAGTWNWVFTRGKFVTGSPDLFVGFAMNVTERRQMEEALRESETRFRSYFDLPLHGIAITSPGKGWIEVNQRVCSILGYGREELLCMTWSEITHPDDLGADAEQFERMLSRELDQYQMQKRFIRKDETVVWTNLAVGCVRKSDGSVDYVIALLEDITDRKRAEEEKAKLESQLHQAQKMESVGRLAGGVAHDFNNMLAVILGYTEMAMSHVNPSQPLHADLGEIRKAAERSADLTRQLLAFARKQTVAPKVLDLNETVSGMLRMLQRLIGEGIRLHWHPGANLWPIQIDPSQIDQILANLCVNARDAIADVGQVTIQTENRTLDANYCAGHADFRPGDYVLLTVSDNGCGMDEKTQSRIFEPFFTSKEIGKGTGLGLATIYGIVMQNGGFISVYSEVGQGTAFAVYLARHEGDARQARPEAAQEAPACGPETILLAEDEPALLKIAAAMLKSLGYSVLAANTPGEAVQLAREHGGQIHLLMTDVVMPEMNGRDLAKNLLSLYPHIKRLFMSGYTADVIAHHGVLEEGTHFIQKPFSIDDLAVKVRNVLDSQKDEGRRTKDEG